MSYDKKDTTTIEVSRRTARWLENVALRIGELHNDRPSKKRALEYIARNIKPAKFAARVLGL